MNTTVEHERTANALLLFYEKARPKGGPLDGDDGPHDAEMAGAEDGGQSACDKDSGVRGKGEGDENAAPANTAAVVKGKDGGDGVSSMAAFPGKSGGKRAPDSSTSVNLSPDSMSTSTESDLEGTVGCGSGTGGRAGGVGEGGKRAMVKAGEEEGRKVAMTADGVPLLDGVEAFSEEVWQANMQFMLNSYVFDTEFHHFLRRVYGVFCGVFFAGVVECC